MANRRKTKEELIANKMIDLVQDVTLNLDEVGVNVAMNSPNVLYNRLEVVMESAKESREERQKIWLR
jgi:hypothetical protein